MDQAHQPEACEYWESWDRLGNLTRNSHFLNPGLEPCPSGQLPNFCPVSGGWKSHMHVFLPNTACQGCVVPRAAAEVSQCSSLLCSREEAPIPGAGEDLLTPRRSTKTEGLIFTSLARKMSDGGDPCACWRRVHWDSEQVLLLFQCLLLGTVPYSCYKLNFYLFLQTGAAGLCSRYSERDI